MTSNIVHLGQGKTVEVDHGNYIDPTVAKPRATIPAIRLQVLRRLRPTVAAKPMPIELGPIRYVPGPLLAMREGQCRYPLDDGRFCGARSMKNKSWCDHHDAVVHGRLILEAAE